MRSTEDTKEKAVGTRENSAGTREEGSVKSEKMEKPEKEGGSGSGGGKTGRRKKYISRILGVLIILAVFLGMNYVAVLCFDKPRNGDYYNSDIKRLQDENAKIGMIIMGSSQVYHGCNPDLIAQEMGTGEVINCASAASHSDGMYYMLKDLLQRFTPECVVIDLSWQKFFDKNVAELSLGKNLSADRMSWPNKLDYAVHCFSADEWLNLLCPIYRYGSSVWGTSQLRKNYRARKELMEGRWEHKPNRGYQKNGFFWSNRYCPQGSIPTQWALYSDDLISDYEYSYVRKMWELCHEKGIPVVWITMPTSIGELYGIENYQGSADFMKAFAEELGCQYLNFSLMKNREEILPDPMYSDTIHLNGKGSVVFAPCFARALKMALNGEDTSGLFYENFEEMKKDVHRIVACNGRVNPNGDGTLTAEAVSFQSEGITPEYRLVLIDKAVVVAQEKAEMNEEDDDGSADAGAADTGAAADGTADDGAADAGTADAGAAADGAGSVTEASESLPEVRGWQEETIFTINESEIPKGKVLRLEVRQKGKEEIDAYQNGLESEFRQRRND